VTIIVDPPQGWMYGFPTVLQDDYEQQLRNAGYPEKDLPFALTHSRFLFDQKEDFEEYKRKLNG
jgi:hypothetical protein